MKFIAQTKGGKIYFENPGHQARFHDWCLKDRDITIEEIDKTKKRSDQQNRYYWMYLNLIEVETGTPAPDLHEYFRRALLTPRIILVMNKEVLIARSTTELNKIEFGEYLDKICSLTGIALPDKLLSGYLPN